MTCFLYYLTNNYLPSTSDFFLFSHLFLGKDWEDETFLAAPQFVFLSLF